MAGDTGEGTDDPDALSAFRQFFALDGDVLVLSASLFAFSLGFQMTGRYTPRYLSVLGAGASPSACTGVSAPSSAPSTPTPAARSRTASGRGRR